MRAPDPHQVLRPVLEWPLTWCVSWGEGMMWDISPSQAIHHPSIDTCTYTVMSGMHVCR